LEQPTVAYLSIRPLWKDAVSEFLGTLTFVYIALAGVNQVVLSSQGFAYVDQFHIAMCFAMGLTAGIVIAGKSGGHLNPGVSFTMFIFDEEFSFKKFVIYSVSQLLGGFTAGLLVLSVYYSWINNSDNKKQYIGSFGTLKNGNNSLFAGILDQFIGSALLMLGILLAPDSHFKPMIIGIVLGGLGLFQGSNGFAFNLARDFGPRVASSIVFGSDVFKYEDHWFWVPAIVPFFGIPFGYIVYKSLQFIN
jgi:aquaglyceroporin related protein